MHGCGKLKGGGPPQPGGLGIAMPPPQRCCAAWPMTYSCREYLRRQEAYEAGERVAEAERSSEATSDETLTLTSPNPNPSSRNPNPNPNPNPNL